MTYQEWKEIRKINGRDIVEKNPDRMERWKQIARSEYAFDLTFEARRKRETM